MGAYLHAGRWAWEDNKVVQGVFEMIFVTWQVICDLCGRHETTRVETQAYSDEMAVIPLGWNASFNIPPEYRTEVNWDICEACPDCQENPNWERYKAVKQAGGDVAI